MLKKILDIIFPPKCAFCGEILTNKMPICQKCMAALPFMGSKVCRICASPLEEFSYELCPVCQSEKRYFKHSFVPLIYEGAARAAIIRLKFSSHPYYSKAFAYLMTDKLLSSEYFTDFDYITCVPQNPSTRRQRGYNQSELIAREMSLLLKIPFIHTLIRTDDGQRQATLSRQERLKNVQKSYFCKDISESGKRILLVDDVYTTGATTNYCSKLLRKMGFEEVYIAVATIRI